MDLDALSCCSLKEIKKLEGGRSYLHSHRTIRGELGKLHLISTQNWESVLLPLKPTKWDAAPVHVLKVSDSGEV